MILEEKSETKTIEKLIKEFFAAAGYFIEIRSMDFKQEGAGQVLSVNLGTDDAQMLIGKQGLVLSDIQLLLRKILNKHLDKEIFLNLDIDNYKRKKEDYLRDLATDVANEVCSTGKEKEIALPSPFDRRVVHMELGKRENVIVESVGEGEDRHIVVRPKIQN
jgi:spoIIIJ-associated protein